jgi:hypothetical protein
MVAQEGRKLSAQRVVSGDRFNKLVSALDEGGIGFIHSAMYVLPGRAIE